MADLFDAFEEDPLFAGFEEEGAPAGGRGAPEQAAKAAEEKFNKTNPQVAIELGPEAELRRQSSFEDNLYRDIDQLGEAFMGSVPLMADQMAEFNTLGGPGYVGRKAFQALSNPQPVSDTVTGALKGQLQSFGNFIQHPIDQIHDSPLEGLGNASTVLGPLVGGAPKAVGRLKNMHRAGMAGLQAAQDTSALQIPAFGAFGKAIALGEKGMPYAKGALSYRTPKPAPPGVLPEAPGGTVEQAARPDGPIELPPPVDAPEFVGQTGDPLPAPVNAPEPFPLATLHDAVPEYVGGGPKPGHPITPAPPARWQGLEPATAAELPSPVDYPGRLNVPAPKTPLDLPPTVEGDEMVIESFTKPQAKYERMARGTPEPGPGEDALERAVMAAQKRPPSSPVQEMSPAREKAKPEGTGQRNRLTPPKEKRPSLSEDPPEFAEANKAAREEAGRVRHERYKATLKERLGGKTGREAYSTPESENVLTAIQSGAEDAADLIRTTKGKYTTKQLESILSRLEATDQITPEQRAKFKLRK